VPERAKVAMVTAGCWRSTRPEVRGHAGFRINALVSLLANASWAKLAAEFLANTVLAEGWREAGAELKSKWKHPHGGWLRVDAAAIVASTSSPVASEKRVTRYTRGKPVRRWERLPGKRAETWDALVLATAARSVGPLSYMTPRLY
jgi:hypothetical protein